MKVLSLFDGMSCGRVAFDRANININRYFASEIDKYAIKVSKHNWKDIEYIGDINKLNPYDFKDVDFIIGGSPCQGLSFAGKKEGLDDIRSNLFFEFVRFVKIIKPKYFLLENVQTSLRTINIMSNALGVNPVVLNSNLVSAQNRKRLYWANFGITQPKDKKLFLKDIWDGGIDVTEKYYAKKIGTTSFKRSRKSVKSLYEKSNTITTQTHNIASIGGTSIKIADRYYSLTPLVCERLQTVDDDYTLVGSISNTQRYKMIGNGWTINMISHILKCAIDGIPKSKKQHVLKTFRKN
jgi:DNA-cytosine methyltransferase